MEIIEHKGILETVLQQGVYYNTALHDAKDVEDNDCADNWQSFVPVEVNIEESKEPNINKVGQENEEEKNNNNDGTDISEENEGEENGRLEEANEHQGVTARKSKYTITRGGNNFCPYCNYHTRRKDHFKRHVLRHPEQTLYTIDKRGGEVSSKTCPECGYTTLRADHYKRHMMRHSSDKPFWCNCGFSAIRAEHLQRHLIKNNESEYHFPISCSDSISSKSEFITLEDLIHNQIKREKHKFISEREPSVVGYFCWGSNENESEETPNLTDDDWQSILPVEANVEALEDKESPDNKAIEVTPTKKRRGRPPKVKSSIRGKAGKLVQRVCSECGYTTSRSDHFNRHVLRHKPIPKQPASTHIPDPESQFINTEEGKDPFICSDCGYSTKRKDHFTRHMLRHQLKLASAARKPSIGIPIMKRGRGKQGIKVKQNWPYTCNDCYYVTFRRDHFSKHILRHKQQHSLIDVPSKSPTKKRRPKGVQLCSYCGYATSRSYHFKRHMLRHTASKNGSNELNADANLIGKTGETLNHDEEPEAKRAKHSGALRVCEHCGYSTMRSDHFKRHLLRKSHRSSSSSDGESYLNTLPIEVNVEPLVDDEIPVKETNDSLLGEAGELPITPNRRGRPSRGLRVCQDCGYSTMRGDHFRRHQVQHKNDGRPMSSSSKKRGRPSKGLRVCSDCDYTTQRGDLFQKHISKHRRGSLFNELHVSSDYSKLQPDSFIRHQQLNLASAYIKADNPVNSPLNTSQTNGGSFQNGEGENLPSVLPSEINKMHLARRRGRPPKGPRVCIDCGYSTMCIATFNDHILSHRRDQNHDSLSAGNSSENKKQPCLNVGNGGKVRPELCVDECKSKTDVDDSQESESIKIKRQHHSPHKCELCGYITMRRDHLKRHLMRHTGEKPFACELCEYRTTHSAHLKRHRAVHSDYRRSRQSCTEAHCAKQSSTFRSHMRYQTRNKPFICSTCGYATIKKSLFSYHTKIHEVF